MKKLLVFLAVCTWGYASAQTASRTDPVNNSSTYADPTVKDFVTEASQMDRKEIRAGKMAQQKAQSAEVRAFADMMVLDHTKSSAELKTIAAKNNISLIKMRASTPTGNQTGWKPSPKSKRVNSTATAANYNTPSVSSSYSQSESGLPSGEIPSSAVHQAQDNTSAAIARDMAEADTTRVASVNVPDQSMPADYANSNQPVPDVSNSYTATAAISNQYMPSTYSDSVATSTYGAPSESNMSLSGESSMMTDAENSNNSTLYYRSQAESNMSVNGESLAPVIVDYSSQNLNTEDPSAPNYSLPVNTDMASSSDWYAVPQAESNYIDNTGTPNNIANTDSYPEQDMVNSTEFVSEDQSLNSLNLSSGKNFDREYMQMMVDDHAKAISLYETAATSSNADVRAFAKKTLPVLRKHQDSAISILNSLPAATTPDL